MTDDIEMTDATAEVSEQVAAAEDGSKEPVETGDQVSQSQPETESNAQDAPDATEESAKPKPEEPETEAAPAQSEDVDMQTPGKSPSVLTNVAKSEGDDVEPQNDEVTGVDNETNDNGENNDTAASKTEYLGELNVDEDIDMEFKDTGVSIDESEEKDASEPRPPLPQFTRKDKTLLEFLNSMDEYSPIIPDAVTDYYLAKSGFETTDRRIKRLLALATQKFISDIASDAYQYSRIRSASSVSSSSNPQARAKALMAGMNGAAVNVNPASGPNATGQPTQSTNTAGMSSSNQGKLVLTMEDLGSALAEYGLNVRRPDFYR